MIFNLFKKEKNNDQQELLEKAISGVEAMLQTQVVMITGDLSPRNSLPKDKWVYGYIYGFVDSFFQLSVFKNNEDAWIEAGIRIFKMFYGDEGVEIGKKCIKLLEDEDKYFAAGCHKGGQEVKTYLIKGDTKDSPMGLVFYMTKKNKNK